MSKPYVVHFGPAAERAYEKLPARTRGRVRTSLERLAADLAGPERIHGKRVKTIRGAADSFHRLRVGDYRVMFDLIESDQVVLVLGIVHRRDLERWLRSR